MNRRRFLQSGAASAAIILTPGLLMPVRPPIAVPRIRAHVAVLHPGSRDVIDWIEVDYEQAMQRAYISVAAEGRAITKITVDNVLAASFDYTANFEREQWERMLEYTRKRTG